MCQLAHDRAEHQRAAADRWEGRCYLGCPSAQKPPMHWTSEESQQSPPLLHFSPMCEQPPGGGMQT